MSHNFGIGRGLSAPQASFQGLFDESLAIEHHRRLEAYRRFWLFYLGKHWTHIRDPGDPTITLNYSRRIVDILSDFTFKKGFKVIIPDDPTTEIDEKEDREFVRRRLEETWRKNQKQLWMLEAGQAGGVTGDVFVRVSWEKNDPLEDPYSRADIIPGHLVFPEFGGSAGVDRKKLKRVIILLPVFERLKEGQESAPSQGKFLTRKTALNHNQTQRLTVIAEEWTNPEIDLQGNEIKPAMFRRYINGEPEGPAKENPLGEIPLVHISNYPLTGEYYGLSDILDVVELNRELNEKTTDISDIINYHSSPVTIIKGAKVKDLERGANRMWAIPGDADVFNLKLDGDLVAAQTHWSQLKDSLLEMGGVPEIALGKFQPVSNTTGVALAIQYLPMMEKRNIKVLTYGMGLRLINRLLLKTTEIMDTTFGEKMDKLTGDNRYRNDVVFPDPMPNDEIAELEKSQARLGLGLSTKMRELERMGISQGEAKKILTDAMDEVQEESDRMFDMAPGKGGVLQPSRGGPDATRGQKISATIGQRDQTLGR